LVAQYVATPGDGDDVATASRKHPPGSDLRAHDHAVDVDGQRASRQRVWLVDEPTDRKDPGVVHQNVDGPQPTFHLVEEAGERVAICHVERARHVEPKVRTRLFDRLLIDVADGDLRPEQVQCRRGGQPDPAGAAGDDDDLSAN